MKCPDIQLEPNKGKYFSNNFEDLDEVSQFEILKMLEDCYNDEYYEKSEINIFENEKGQIFLEMLSLPKNIKNNIINITRKTGEEVAKFLDFDLEEFREFVYEKAVENSPF